MPATRSVRVGFAGEVGRGTLLRLVAFMFLVFLRITTNSKLTAARSMWIFQLNYRRDWNFEIIRFQISLIDIFNITLVAICAFVVVGDASFATTLGILDFILNDSTAGQVITRSTFRCNLVLAVNFVLLAFWNSPLALATNMCALCEQ